MHAAVDEELADDDSVVELAWVVCVELVAVVALEDAAVPDDDAPLVELVEEVERVELARLEDPDEADRDPVDEGRDDAEDVEG